MYHKICMTMGCLMVIIKHHSLCNQTEDKHISHAQITFWNLTQHSNFRWLFDTSLFERTDRIWTKIFLFTIRWPFRIILRFREVKCLILTAWELTPDEMLFNSDQKLRTIKHHKNKDNNFSTLKQRWKELHLYRLHTHCRQNTTSSWGMCST